MILCDNQQVVNLTNAVVGGTAPTRPSMCSSGTWLSVLVDFLTLHPWDPRVRLVWVKAHVGFKGNEVADGLAKWSAHSLGASPFRPFRHSLEFEGSTTAGRAPRTAIKSLTPSHVHADLSVTASFDWFRKTSWFGILPFKWVSGTVFLPHYHHFNELNDYHCHLCDHPHPRDPASQLALCSRFSTVIDQMIKSWSPPFTAMAREWWDTADRVQKRHFGRTLVPRSLMDRFKSYPWDSRDHFRTSLGQELASRREALNLVVYDAFSLMRDTPIIGGPTPAINLPLRENRWAGEFGDFSTTRGRVTHSHPRYTPPHPSLRQWPARRPPDLGLTPHR